MNPRNFILALSAALLLGLTSAFGLQAQNDPDDAPSAQKQKPIHRGARRDDQVTVTGENNVAADQTVHDAVAIMGPLTVDGRCTGDAVAIMGSNTVNGTVDHDVVCVMGDLTLGPGAYVAHDVVCVMGTLHRDPEAYVGGSVVHQMGLGSRDHFVPLHHWWLAGLSHGQLLPIGPHLFWIWGVNLLMIGLYVVLALLFPTALRRTGDMLVEHPLHVLLAGSLAILALPLLFVLLLVTVIGIPVAIILLPLAFGLLVFFGKAALYGLLGRRISGDRASLAASVLLGGVIAILVLTCPYVGIGFYLLISYLGFGCALTALVFSRKSAPVVASPVPPAASVYSTPAPPDPPAPQPHSAPSEPFRAAPPGPLPPTLPLDATLPRANFWMRTGAMAIDIVLVAVALGLIDHAFGPFPFRMVRHDHSGPGPFLILLAGYAAVMWKLKGTTVGGLICHLQLVRVDGRPIDWPTAIVRALGCFVSLCALGLGFVWVAFDPERQSWHDKLAGTTVVISVTRRSLV